ncbi:MAG: DUF2284 domain-containing protein [Eggerthellaceae bacterium]|nr:DUF2284 domain-containing protein [Eggerthellaceae bacterium]
MDQRFDETGNLMSDELEILEKIADECGFECHGVADSKKLVVRPEVRDMCAVGKCHVYGKSWACPPACGDIEEFDAMFKQHSMCFIVQSVGQLEDEFDFETMVETEQIHKERFFAFGDKLREAGLSPVMLAAGTCRVCPSCTYPDEPCRFPNKRMVSMEASGLVVAEACGLAGIPYNHGNNTLAYSSCAVL